MLGHWIAVVAMHLCSPEQCTSGRARTWWCDASMWLTSMQRKMQTKLGEAGVVLQPAMPVHLDKALQQQYAATWPPDGAQTLELTCLGQVHLHVGADEWPVDRVP